MASSNPMGQQAAVCDLCKHKEVKLLCISCQYKLCKECVGNHTTEELPKVHKVVKYEDRHTHFSHQFCMTHSDRQCDTLCTDCDIPICPDCLTGHHKDHSNEKLPKEFLTKRKEILEDNEAMEESLIPKYTQEDVVTRSKIANLSFSYKSMEKEMATYKRKWEEEVKKIFARFASELHALQGDDLTPFKCHEDKIKTGIKEMHQTLGKNRKLLKAARVSEILSYTSERDQFQSLPMLELEPNPPALILNSEKGKTSRFQLEDLISLLLPPTCLPFTSLLPNVQKQLLDKVAVLATVQTPFHAIRDLACAGMNKVWVNAIGDYEDTALSCFDICGDKLDSVTVGSFCNGLTMDSDGNLLYSEFNNVMTYKNGETNEKIEIPDGWEAMGISCSRSGNVLICLMNVKNEHKVHQYKDKACIKEFQCDENGEKLYKNGEYMLYPQENVNGDVCVVNHNSNSIITVSSEGKLRFRYDGKDANLTKDLNPNAFVTDSMGRVIVADEANDCLHVIDQDGKFLRCLEIPGLTKPTGISLDSRGRLWVGSKDNGAIKVVQYAKYAE